MGIFNTVKYCRSKFLSDLSTYMQKSYEENKLKDIIIMGDINEHIEEKNITQFINENGLINVYK